MVNIHIPNKVFFLLLTITITIIVGLGVLAFGTTDPTTFGHDAGELDLGPITISGDNVGIGTTTPAHKFQINEQGLVIDTFNSLGDINPAVSGIWVTDGQ
ncbi:MAG: hypothetical protein QF535_15890, partial [Anaerolineales bacterium]|nr:hypothetical protein [Anaerolineales bacterium]